MPRTTLAPPTAAGRAPDRPQRPAHPHSRLGADPRFRPAAGAGGRPAAADPARAAPTAGQGSDADAAAWARHGHHRPGSDSERVATADGYHDADDVPAGADVGGDAEVDHAAAPTEAVPITAAAGPAGTDERVDADTASDRPDDGERTDGGDAPADRTAARSAGHLAELQRARAEAFARRTGATSDPPVAPQRAAGRTRGRLRPARPGRPGRGRAPRSPDDTATPQTQPRRSSTWRRPVGGSGQPPPHRPAAGPEGPRRAGRTTGATSRAGEAAAQAVPPTGSAATTAHRACR